MTAPGFRSLAEVLAGMREQVAGWACLEGCPDIAEDLADSLDVASGQAEAAARAIENAEQERPLRETERRREHTRVWEDA